MPFENRTWKFLIPVVGTLFLAAACGGGGGGDDGGDDGRSESAALATFLTAASVAGTEDAAEENILLRATAAAAEAPVGAGTTGGVYQQADSSALAATPQIIIAIDRGAASTDATVDVTDNDRRTFDITIGGDTINTVANAAGTGTNGDGSGVDNAGLTETVDEDEPRFVTFVQRRGTAEAPTGNLHVWVSTDTPNSVGGDDDYLAYGFWVDSVNGDGTATTTDDGIDQIGAFVDSNDEIVFPGASVAALTGDAVYIGEASGLYLEEVGGESDFMGFTADARLTASFGDGTALGTVGGTINNFEGLPSEFDGLEVMLADATPDAANGGGFFNATTSATLTTFQTNADGDATDTEFTGTWGGKFYDDRNLASAADAYPGTVAGTFGIASTIDDPDDATVMDHRALLGIYWGDYDPDPLAVPTP